MGREQAFGAAESRWPHGHVRARPISKVGPNHAADPMLTRTNPDSGELQLVVIKRGDTGTWALPGGMVDPGEAVSTTVRREFDEEAGALKDPQKGCHCFGDRTLRGGEVVYAATSTTLATRTMHGWRRPRSTSTAATSSASSCRSRRATTPPMSSGSTSRPTLSSR